MKTLVCAHTILPIITDSTFHLGFRDGFSEAAWDTIVLGIITLETLKAQRGLIVDKRKKLEKSIEIRVRYAADRLYFQTQLSYMN